MTDETAGVQINEVTDQAALGQLAELAASVIGADTRYISHGEIQTGLSEDSAHWSPNLKALFAEDFATLGELRTVLSASDADGVSLGFAIVAWEETPRRKFAVLEDLVIEPLARSLGIGTRLVAAVEQHATLRGAEWLFLESGRRNQRAHHFFERNGFSLLSHVFGKRLNQRC